MIDTGLSIIKCIIIPIGRSRGWRANVYFGLRIFVLTAADQQKLLVEIRARVLGNCGPNIGDELENLEDNSRENPVHQIIFSALSNCNIVSQFGPVEGVSQIAEGVTDKWR